LFLQGSEFLRTNELLDIACSQYGLTAEEYCDSMRKDGVWGDGSRHGVRVRSGGRARSRGECTFPKREVIAKYLPRDQTIPCTSNDYIGIIDKMKKLMNGKIGDESSSISIEYKAKNHPLTQLKIWCDQRCEALRVAFQE